MIFEDAHWTDPTSLEAFGRAVDRVKTLPALLIVTFRPEFNPPWVGQSHVTSLTLNRLGEREAATIIERLVGNKELPADVMAEIVERTDGIPLFVEEMTKAVLEAESEGEARRTVAAVPSPALAVPASLHASLMARLDRLGPAKEVAQIGAAIGREFSHALLAAVMREPEAELDRRSTVSLRLVCCSGRAFRRTRLICSSMRWCRTRPTAHCCASRDGRFTPASPTPWKASSPEIAESQPELLARHFTEAGLIETAAACGEGGRTSLARSALAEAVEQFKRALEQTATLTATPDDATRTDQAPGWACKCPHAKSKGTLRPRQKPQPRRA